jgi:hypothetical protein
MQLQCSQAQDCCPVLFLKQLQTVSQQQFIGERAKEATHPQLSLLVDINPGNMIL